MSDCYTDDPEGYEACVTECKVYLPENERRYEECIDFCEMKYCVDSLDELIDFTDEVIE